MTLHLSAAFAIAFVLAFVRSVAWVTVCPPFSNSSIPMMLKIGFAGAVALFAAGTLQHDALPLSDAQVITEIVVQAVVGVVLGFVVSLFVTTMVAAGSLIDLFSGLNLPQALDPLSQQQTAIFGQFYNLVLTALLFTSGATMVIVVLFCTQILLALLAKAAPQINVFVFGFPLQILLALVGVGVAIQALPAD